MSKKVTAEENLLRDELFNETEIKTNRMATKALLILGIMYIIMSALGLFDIINFGSHRICHIVFGCGAFSLVVAIHGKFVKYKSGKYKDMIIGSVILSAGIMYFLYPLNAHFIIYGPLIISTMYYKKRTVIKTLIVAWIISGICLWGNVILDIYNETIHVLHDNQGALIWRNPWEVVFFYQIPQTVLLLVTTFICYEVTKNGRGLMLEQAHIITEASKVEAEFKAASDIQLSSLPNGEFSTKDGKYKISAVMKPAKTVGGDFYDYYANDRNLVFLVADVSDKGLPAAMFMMKAKNAVRTAMESSMSLKDAVIKANNELCEDNPENMFVTMLVGRLDISTGKGEYVNCGHLAPIIRRGDGSILEVDEIHNVPLGIFKTEEFTPQLLYLFDNETIFLFTDGFTDATNPRGEQYGLDKLVEAIKKLDITANNPCDNLQKYVENFMDGEDKFDDMTALSVTNVL